MEGLDEFLAKNLLLLKILEAENEYDINFYNDEEISCYMKKINKKIGDLKRLCDEIIKIKNERDLETIEYYKNEEEIERLSKLKVKNDEYDKLDKELKKLERENVCTSRDIESKKFELKKIQDAIEKEKLRIDKSRKEEQEFRNKSIEKCREITSLEDNVKKIKEKEKQVANSILDDEKNIIMLEKHLKNILKILLKCQRSYEVWITDHNEDNEKFWHSLNLELKNLKEIENKITMPEKQNDYENMVNDIDSEMQIKILDHELENIYKNINDGVNQLNDIEKEIYQHQLKILDKQLLYGEVKACLDIQNIKEKRQQQIAIIEKILPKPTIYEIYKNNQVKKIVPMIYTDDKKDDNSGNSKGNSKKSELEKIKEEIEDNNIVISNMEQEFNNNLELRMAKLLAENDKDLLPLVEELSECSTNFETKIPQSVLMQRIKFLKDILVDGITLLQDEKAILQRKLSLITNDVNDHHSSINRLQNNISLKEKNLSKCLKNKSINEEKYKNIIGKIISNNNEEYQNQLEEIEKQKQEINRLNKFYEYLTKQRNIKKVELNQMKVDNSNLSNKLKVAKKKYEENIAQRRQEEMMEEMVTQLNNDISLLKNEINEKENMLKKLEEANDKLKKEIKEIELDREFNIFS
ncbi:Hypothetical protein SRAE_X000121600 [Strongyloides ratti]|uniref:Uncharacterized protein n=1 Tax=Strongyloides ratti TaxID=34506 RepID=A0A090KPF3_STRRB|nr:Hypothetical protein SRAE_X000121600 [Strongyloides ratti]CEF59468.1 Hypothetical protein SRAE_X000121600 [Strongyloides ratti]